MIRKLPLAVAYTSQRNFSSPIPQKSEGNRTVHGILEKSYKIDFHKRILTAFLPSTAPRISKDNASHSPQSTSNKTPFKEAPQTNPRDASPSDSSSSSSRASHETTSTSKVTKVMTEGKFRCSHPEQSLICYGYLTGFILPVKLFNMMSTISLKLMLVFC